MFFLRSDSEGCCFDLKTTKSWSWWRTSNTKCQNKWISSIVQSSMPLYNAAKHSYKCYSYLKLLICNACKSFPLPDYNFGRYGSWANLRWCTRPLFGRHFSYQSFFSLGGLNKFSSYKNSEIWKLTSSHNYSGTDLVIFCKTTKIAIFEVFTVVSSRMPFFWDVTKGRWVRVSRCSVATFVITQQSNVIPRKIGILFRYDSW